MITTIVICACFFALTMLIVFVLRASDQRTRGFKNTVKKLEQHESEIKKYDEDFKNDIREIDSKLRELSTESRAVLQNVAEELVNLKSYSEDLGKLHAAMTTYQNSIAAIVRLTEDTDAKIGQIKADAESLESVKLTIENFKLELSELEKNIVDDEKNTITVISEKSKDVQSQFDSYVSDFEQRAQSVIEKAQDAVRQAEEAAHQLEVPIFEPAPEPVVKTEDIPFEEPSVDDGVFGIKDMDFDDDGKEDSEEIIFN